MSKRTLLVDDTQRELCTHGTESFPMTVSHDDFWDFEGKTVPIHWHSDLEISLPRKGKAIYQIYEKSYYLKPGEVLLINQNVPHSCHSSDNQPAKYSTILVRPDFMYGDFGSDVERNCFRPFLQNSAIPCVVLSPDNPSHCRMLEKLNQIEQLFDQKPYCYELKIKGLLCQVFTEIFAENQKICTHYIPSNQLELERLEQMLNYLNTHFDSVISLQQLADQIHLSREVCCRLFKKMTGKTITTYLEEYRTDKAFSLVQSGQYSITQIASMVGFSNASCFANSFRKHFGCNPGEYNSLKQKK